MIRIPRRGAIHTPNGAAPALGARLMAPRADLLLPRRTWFAKTPSDGEMLLNDQLGCCVQVAWHWWIRALVATLTGTVLAITDQMILEAYEADGGYVSGDPATDRGTDTSANMLKRCAVPGLDVTGTPHPIWWARVEPAQRQLALSRTPCLATLLLPDAAVEETALWGRAPGAGAGWAPNPANAHRVMVGAFDGRDVWVNTWGEHPYVHPEFFDTYAAQDGFDVPIHRTLADPAHLDWAGIDLTALAADIEGLNAAA